MSDREQPTPEAAAAAGRGSMRVSHEDRDQVAEALRVAAGDGRLTADELDERLEQALTARTYDDLATLVTDLPAAGTTLVQSPGATLPDGVPPKPPKDLIKIHATSGQSRRDGRWVVPARMDLKVTSGQITLDFTEAIITQPTLHVDAEVGSGQVLLLIRPGIAVDLDDVSVRSGQVKVRAPWGDSVPASLRVTVAGSCRSGAINVRPPRRTFWQWLRRAPRRYEIAA